MRGASKNLTLLHDLRKYLAALKWQTYNIINDNVKVEKPAILTVLKENNDISVERVNSNEVREKIRCKYIASIDLLEYSNTNIKKSWLYEKIIPNGVKVIDLFNKIRSVIIISSRYLLFVIIL